MKKGNFWALAPIFVFLVLYIGIGVYMGDFYVMPAAVGFLIALLVAFFQNPKRSLADKLSTLARGAGDENIMIMCVIFLLAGAFSASVKAAGGADAAVAFGLAILPSRIVVVGLFLIGCFISTSMGTSVGTIVALQPIAMGISEQAGISLPVCIAAVVCGAMFGDNLSMISDTTIAAARTQGCEMRDKFRENFMLVLPAAIVTAVIFFVLTLGSDYQSDGGVTAEMVLRIVPYLFVLVGALVGLNVILLLATGTALSLGVGLVMGDFAWSEIFGIMNDGMTSMFEITVISILVAGMVGLIRENGGIDWLLTTIRRSIRSRKGAELGIAALSGLVDCATANNTVAIVISGPIAKEIADEYQISPQRTASLLDIFTSVFQGLLPYGVQILYAANAAVTGLTPFDVIPYCFYPMLMAVSAVCFILFKKEKAGTVKGA
ncbi:Na+/H+ antiporter NhaC family protein [Butyricicoccus sp. 1XD8-22]|nr:Na+/H+ antiporter NhaC family protein [Butyricicoccus sp. 1XD8-22]